MLNTHYIANSCVYFWGGWDTMEDSNAELYMFVAFFEHIPAIISFDRFCLDSQQIDESI